MKENIILQRKIILVLQNTELSKPRLNFSDHYNLVSHNASALESATLGATTMHLRPFFIHDLPITG